MSIELHCSWATGVPSCWRLCPVTCCLYSCTLMCLPHLVTGGRLDTRNGMKEPGPFGESVSTVTASITVGTVEMESDGTRRSTGGEVKGKEANGVGSQHSCTVSEHGLSNITNADAHTSAASSRLTRHPRGFKWTRPFRRKTKSGFCACAITFRFHSTVTGVPSHAVQFKVQRSVTFSFRVICLHCAVQLADILFPFKTRHFVFDAARRAV